MAAASRTQDCAMGFLGFSWLGVCTISFKDNYWSNSTLLATLDLCLAVTGWIPISFFFLQCFYQFAFSFMHYIQMLLFFVVFLFSWIVDIWKLLPAGLGEGDGHGPLAFPDLSYSALLGTLVLICRAWCMTV